MKLNRNQVSKLQQAAWNLEATLNLLTEAGFDQHDMTYKKVRNGLEEIYTELDTYELGEQQ